MARNQCPSSIFSRFGKYVTDLGLIGILIGWTTTKLILLITGLIKVWGTDIGGEIEKSRLRVAKSTYGSFKTNEADEKIKNYDNEHEKMGTGARTEKDSHCPGPIESSYSEDQLSGKEAEFDKSYDALESHREVKIVVSAFVLSAIWFSLLAGMSFLRDKLEL